MQLPIHELATGTILERSPTFDVDFSGNVPSSYVSCVATNKEPHRGQTLAKLRPETLAEKLFEVGLIGENCMRRKSLFELDVLEKTLGHILQ